MHQNVFENRNNPIERTEEEIQLGFNFTKTSSRTFTRSLSRKQDFPIKRAWIVGSFACVGSKCRSEIGRRILSGEIASFIHPFICHARFPVSLISNIRFQRWWWGGESRRSISSPACNKVSIYPSILGRTRTRCSSWVVPPAYRHVHHTMAAEREKKKKNRMRRRISSFRFILHWDEIVKIEGCTR